MDQSRQFLQNFSWLTVGRTVGDACLFALFVVLSNSYGPEGIGRYSFAMALTGLFAAVADFGLYPYSLIEFSREDRFGVLFARVLALRVPLLVLTWTALALAVVLDLLPAGTAPVVLLLGAYQLLITVVDGVKGIFVAKGDPGLAARTELALKFACALAAIALARAGADLVEVVAVLPALAAVSVVVALRMAARRYGAPVFAGVAAGFRGLAREALPYAESQLLAQVCARIDVVLLGFLAGAGAAGVYNAGYRVVFLLLFIPQFAAVSLTPHASRLHRLSAADFAVFFHKSLGAVLLVAAPCTAGLWLIGPKLVSIVFGDPFEGAGAVLRTLSLVLGLSFLNRTVGSFLMAADLQHARNRVYRLAAVVSVVGNALLIPAFGIQGAALAAVTTEAVLSALFIAALRPAVGWPRVGSRLWISLLGAGSFFVPFALLPAARLYVVVPLSLLIYAGVLATFRETRQGELRSVLRFIGI